jgi:hypothetical protein
MLLQEALQDFAPARPIFWRYRIDHPLSASRVWFSLRDRFKLQLGTRHTVHTRSRYNTPRLRTRGTTHARSHDSSQSSVDTPPSRVLYHRHTSRNHHSHKQYHGNTPPPPTHTSHITDRRHRGINSSTLKFKQRLEQFKDRPSDRPGSTHTFTHTFTHPQSPMPKRLSPHGATSKGKRVEKSDGVTPEPIHHLATPHPLCTTHPKIIFGCPLLRGGGKSKEGHAKNNTMRVSRKRHTYTSRLRWSIKRTKQEQDFLTEDPPISSKNLVGGTWQ